MPRANPESRGSNPAITDDELELFSERVAIVAESESEEVAQEVAREALERHRHACEVAAIVKDFKRYGKQHVQRHLRDIAYHRGQEQADRLYAAAIELWQKQRKSKGKG